MPRVPPFDRPATYDDLVGLPDGVVTEILDGELHASPCPELRVAAAAVTLGRILLRPPGRDEDPDRGYRVVSREEDGHLRGRARVPRMADRPPRTIEARRLEDGRWTSVATHVGNEIVRLRPFEASDLPLALLAGSNTEEQGVRTVLAGGAQPPQAPRGAVRSAEIQYAMGNLDLDRRYAWEPADQGALTAGHGVYTGSAELKDGPLRIWPVRRFFRELTAGNILD